MLKYLKLIAMWKDVRKVYEEENQGKAKPWWISRRFYGAVMTLVGGGLYAFLDVTVPAETLDAISGNITTIAGSAKTAIPAAVSLYGAITSVIGMINKSKSAQEDNMKGITKFLAIAMVFMLFGAAAAVCLADDATTTTTTTDVTTATTSSASTITSGFLSIGQDNMWLAESGRGAFLALGAGVDIVSYTKTFNYGGSLVLTLHGTAGVKTEDGSGLFGPAITIDLVKLFTAKGVSFLLDDFKAVLGPVVVYDVQPGKAAYGALLNFSYTLDK